MTKKHHAHEAAGTPPAEAPQAAQAEPAAAEQPEQKTAPEQPPAPAAAEPTPAPAADEVAVFRDRLLRLQADFDNYRKRIQREKAEWAVSANEALFRELLPVVDHYELGLKTAADHKADPAVQDGFRMVYDQLVGALRKSGLTPVDAAAGGPFDPAAQEAVAHVPSNDQPADAILAQTRRGWRLGERMLRPVQVVVSSGPADATEAKS